MVGMWLICLSSDVLKKSKAEALYNIAHELAYVYLEFPKTIDGIEENTEFEDKVVKLVIKWGFKSKLRQKKFHYKDRKKSRQVEFAVEAV